MTDLLMILDVGKFGATIRPASETAQLVEDACDVHRIKQAEDGDTDEAERLNALGSLFSVPEHGIYLGRSDLQAAQDAVAAHSEFLIDEGYASDAPERAERALSHVIGRVDEQASQSSTGGRA